VIVVAAVIEDNDRFLVTQRQPGVHLAGLWEFPGGKIDPDARRMPPRSNARFARSSMRGSRSAI